MSKVDSARALSGRGVSDTVRRSSLGSSGSSGAVQRPAPAAADVEHMWHEGFDAGWRSGATRRTLRMEDAADSYGDGFDKEADYYGGVDMAGGGSPTCWSHCGDEGRAGWEDGEHALRREASVLALGPAKKAEAAAADAVWCQHSDSAAQEATARQQQFSGFSGYNQEGGYNTEGAQYVNFNKKGAALRPVQLVANGSWGDELAMKLAAVSPFGVSAHGSSGTAASSPKGGSPAGNGSARHTPRSSPSAVRKAGRRHAGIGGGGGGGFSPLAGATNAMPIPFSAPFHTQDTAIKACEGVHCLPSCLRAHRYLRGQHI